MYGLILDLTYDHPVSLVFTKGQPTNIASHKKMVVMMQRLHDIA